MPAAVRSGSRDESKRRADANGASSSATGERVGVRLFFLFMPTVPALI
jgi:hypothetical protein